MAAGEKFHDYKNADKYNNIEIDYKTINANFGIHTYDRDDINKITNRSQTFTDVNRPYESYYNTTIDLSGTWQSTNPSSS